MARVDDIMTFERGQRDRRDRLKTQIVGKAPIDELDFVEDRLRPTHQIHLIDCQRDMADAQHRHNAAVAFGLGQHSFAGIDQQTAACAVDAPVAMLRVYCS